MLRTAGNRSPLIAVQVALRVQMLRQIAHQAPALRAGGEAHPAHEHDAIMVADAPVHRLHERATRVEKRLVEIGGGLQGRQDALVAREPVVEPQAVHVDVVVERAGAAVLRPIPARLLRGNDSLDHRRARVLPIRAPEELTGAVAAHPLPTGDVVDMKVTDLARLAVMGESEPFFPTLPPLLAQLVAQERVGL